VDTFVLAQSAPGAIATNSAIFVGYQIAGVPGAIAAMMGMIIPTFVIVIVLALLFVFFQTNHYVLAALNGIRPVIVALIASAAYKMSKTSLIDKTCWIICLICVTVLLVCPDINIIVVILSGAFIGIAIMKVKKMFSTSVKTE
jgi:chromate transporter